MPGTATLTGLNMSGGGGSFTHGSSQVITGSFGTKSPAAPTVWDNCDHGQSITTRWTGGGHPSGGPGDIDLAYTNGKQSQSPAHPRATNYLTGSHDGNNNATQGNQVEFARDFTFSEGAVIYLSFWHSVNSTATGFLQGTAFNWKILNYNQEHGAGYASSVVGEWYSSNSFPPSISQYVVHNDGGAVTPTQNSFSGPIQEVDRRPDWVKYEYEIKCSTGGSGYVISRVDGTLYCNYSGPTDEGSGAGTDRSLNIGGYHGADDDQNPPNRRYWNDIYLDFAVGQVWAGNATTFAASTIREQQIPTAWSGNITITVNLGVFTSGQTLYIHVRDTSGTMHDNVMGAVTAGN